MSRVKGWCPGAHRPMMSGDGLVVRVRPRLARLDRAQALGLAALAQRFGSGVIDLTSRANLQIRGVTEADHEALLQELARLDLLDADASLERRRNVLVTPFWQPGDLTERLTRALLGALPALPELPAKVGFAVDTGAVIWEKDYVSEYGTSVPVWGIVSSPLVDGERLITVVGGEPDALVMAFDKRTGEEIWRAIEVEAEMGYAQPVIYEAGGVRQLIVWHPRALASLNPETGALYWEQPWEVSMGVTVATPVRSGDYLLVSQFFNGSLMMRLNQDRPAATELWRGQSRSELPDQTDTIHAMVTTPLIIGDYVYGVDSYGELRGLDAKTGERLWMSPDMTAQARWSTAFMVRHGDRYFVNNDEGFLILAQFTPSGYIELDRTRLIEPTGGSGSRTPHGRIEERLINWSHPAYANGHIVHRNDREIVRASLRAVDY